MRPILFAVIGAIAVASFPAWAEELVVDGTTVDTYERSIKAMADSLDEKDKKDFGQGLLNMILTEYPAAHGAKGLQLLQFMQPAVEAAHITMHGRTLEEILERGRSIADDDAPAVAEADASDSTESLRQCLRDKVTIESAAIVKGAYSGHNIEVTVTNGLDWAIAGIRIAYQVFSDGRSVPWIDEDFSLSISGGIEPGETRTIGTTAFVPADAPEELTTHSQVLDVSDQYERQLIRDVQVLNWGDRKSEMRCEGLDGT